MLQDAERNAAYSRGIESVVEEDDLVVDIGTGSGIGLTTFKRVKTNLKTKCTK